MFDPDQRISTMIEMVTYGKDKSCTCGAPSCRTEIKLGDVCFLIEMDPAPPKYQHFLACNECGLYLLPCSETEH